MTFARRAEINAWVAEQTHDRIPELFPKGLLDPQDTKRVLTNAIYFKAKWKDEFDKKRTTQQPFHAASGDVDVPMMRLSVAGTRYLEGSGYRAFELPYRAEQVRAMFILPDEGNFDAIEGGLNAEFFASVHTSMEPVLLDYSVPRFSYRTSATLEPMLMALGMKQAFEDGFADFSRITDGEQLYVSAVVHQAFVLVDEEGTEAAAATGAVVNTLASVPIPVEIVLDRPFIYAIYDEPTQQILFLGSMHDPSAAR